VINQTRASLEQDRATDQWGEYQGKKIRGYETQLATDLMGTLSISDKKAAQKHLDDYAKHQAKWNDDLAEVEKTAHEHEQRVKDFEREVDQAEARANHFDLAEALLEIGLVVTSVTLLTRRRIYWYLGIFASVLGVASAALGLLLK
jgi:hypothetical protein